MDRLALAYMGQRMYAQAEPLFTNILEFRRRILGDEHPRTLNSANNLAFLYEQQGKLEQAESMFMKTLELNRRVQGEEHPDTLETMSKLGGAYFEQGKYAQAETLSAKTVELERRVLGEGHAETLSTMHILARAYFEQGKYGQAEPLLQRVLEGRQRVLGGAHRQTLATMKDLGRLYVAQAKYPLAESLLRDALNGYNKQNLDDWERYSSENLLGGSLFGQEKYAEAEPLLVSGYEGMIQREATMSTGNRRELERAGQRIVQFYQDWGKPEKAAEWKHKLDETKRSLSPPKGVTDRRRRPEEAKSFHR